MISSRSASDRWHSAMASGPAASTTNLRYPSASGTSKTTGTSSVRTSSKPASLRSVDVRSALPWRRCPARVGAQAAAYDPAAREPSPPSQRTDWIPAPQERKCHAAPRSQHATRLGESRCGIAHQHVPQPAQDAVDRVVVELDPFRVEDLIADVGYSQLRAPPAGGVQHRGRESLVITRPSSPTRPAASKPVSPVPAASSSTVSPGEGASCVSIHARIGGKGALCRRAGSPSSARGSPQPRS